MERICISFEEFVVEEKETTYELKYNRDSYLIFVPHDGEFHNKMWECEKEVPEELECFLDIVIRKELDKMATK